MLRRIIIPHGLQIRHIQILHSRISAIHCEIRLALLIGTVELRKGCNVALQGGPQSRASLSSSQCPGFFEDQSRVNAVKCGLEGSICVSLILIGVMQVEGVACEHHLGDQGGKTLELVGVPMWLAAIEDRRVKNIGDVVEGFLSEGREIIRYIVLNVAPILGLKVKINRAL